MKKNQYYPFDDFLNPTISEYGPDGEELPWREVAKRMRENPREKISNSLEHLTCVFRNELKHNGEVKALEKFWQEVRQMRDTNFLTDSMEKMLFDAKAGNIKSAQKMVKANPYVIHLPFIARVMAYVLSQHKYCDANPTSQKGKEKAASVLAEVSGSWNDFLPKRTGGPITYSHADLKKLLLLAKKQMCSKKALNRRGREVSVSLDGIRKAVAEALKVSTEYLRRNIKIETKRGRPKK